MAKYSLVIKKSVAKDLRSLPKVAIKKILERIESLRDNPHPVGSLKLSNKERYRIRQGIYRILYEINDNQLTIIVVKVAHRKES